MGQILGETQWFGVKWCGGSSYGTTIEEFQPLEDPRHGNVQRHSLHEILVIAPCTIFCGGKTCADMALFGQFKLEFLNPSCRSGMEFPATAPSPERTACWTRRPSRSGFWGSWASLSKGALAIDGKAIRRSYDRAETKCRCSWSMPGPHNSAWCWDNWPWTTGPTRSPPCSNSWKC